MNIQSDGYQGANRADGTTGIPARITAVHRGHYEFACDSGTGTARLKRGAYREGSEQMPATGDFVRIDRQSGGESRILATLPRSTCFARQAPSTGHGRQVVAANFDYVFILQPLDRRWNPRGLERYLALAWQSGAVPVVLLTKTDCAKDTAAALHAAAAIAAGVDVHALCARTGEGLQALDRYLQPGKTVVLLGPSGAGKSSLINAVAGEELMRSGDVREQDRRGRHTTTHRQLLCLRSGAMVIDTPGMRALGMADTEQGLQKTFAEVEQLAGGCRFRDCRHQSEPGCAVKAAIERGELAPAQWESYRRLRAESLYHGDKAAYLQKKEQWAKDIAKQIRRGKPADYRSEPCAESFACAVCGRPVAPDNAGTQHRNHCPHCLSSLHVDNKPGDRASLCGGVMDPIGVWVRQGGEWAIIHRCRSCGCLHSTRIAADDNPTLLLSIAMKPLASPPFPLWQVEAPAPPAGR